MWTSVRPWKLLLGAPSQIGRCWRPLSPTAVVRSTWSACLHAPAAFVASSVGSYDLMESILDLPPCHSPDLDATLSALSSAVSQPHWQSLDDNDVPLRQHSLSRRWQFTNSSLSQLHLLVPVPWLFCQLYFMPVTGLTVCLQLHLAFISRTRSSVPVWGTAWAFLYTVLLTPALNMVPLQMSLGSSDWLWWKRR